MAWLKEVALVRVEVLGLVIPLLIGVAYFTLVERQWMSTAQRRRGPNVVGIYGLLQPLADGLKLFLKEMLLPSSGNQGLFRLAPVITFSLAIAGWAVMPVGMGMVMVDSNVGILYRFGVSALAVYGVLIAGWASNSKYAFLGALRSTAQMISYEVSLGFIVRCVIRASGTVSLGGIVEAQSNGCWYMFPRLPAFLMFCVGVLAETNRHPFDLPEAEAELVSGYNIEYSAMTFALFFRGEYANMILMSSLTVVLFCGGWLSPMDERVKMSLLVTEGVVQPAWGVLSQVRSAVYAVRYEVASVLPLVGGLVAWRVSVSESVLAWVSNLVDVNSLVSLYAALPALPGVVWFALKVLVFVRMFVWARIAYPRYRYDQLMRLGWKVFLPLSLGLVLMTAGILVATGAAPY